MKRWTKKILRYFFISIGIILGIGVVGFVSYLFIKQNIHAIHFLTTPRPLNLNEYYANMFSFGDAIVIVSDGILIVLGLGLLIKWVFSKDKKIESED